MSDKVELRIGAGRKTSGMKVGHFLSYAVSSDLYTPADAFRLELANPEAQIKTGLICELFINGEKELTGVIDRVQRKISKSGVALTVEGRDYMGLLVDFHCEQAHWQTVEGKKLKELAEMLLKNVPFINRKDIVYQQNTAGKLKGRKAAGGDLLAALDAPQKISQIEPGMTIFDVLKNYSLSRGMLFYCRPDGVLVFGRPQTKGPAEYSLQITRDGAGAGVIESGVVQDISRRYSRVLVVGQQQGNDLLSDAPQINITGASTDATFPFYKLYVAKDNNDSVSPALRARMIMEKQRREGIEMHYTVGRHSQGGQNWRVNAFCRIKDEPQGIDGDYLIYGRTFSMDKQTGPITKLKLGEPGLVA